MNYQLSCPKRVEITLKYLRFRLWFAINVNPKVSIRDLRLTFTANGKLRIFQGNLHRFSTGFFTVVTRLSAAAHFNFSELQMRRSFVGSGKSGAALFKQNLLFVNYNQNF